MIEIITAYNRVARPTCKHWQGEPLTPPVVLGSRLQRFVKMWSNFLVL